jgi:hypothetical protein
VRSISPKEGTDCWPAESEISRWGLSVFRSVGRSDPVGVSSPGASVINGPLPLAVGWGSGR